MLDVHPPHESVHTWRDFFIHIATICVGLLIAVALEQGVEAIHHRHERRDLEEQMRVESVRNLDLVKAEIHFATARSLYLGQCLQALQSPSPSGDSVTVMLPANRVALSTGLLISPSQGTWTVARAAGTVALLPPEEAKIYARLNLAEDFEQVAEAATGSSTLASTRLRDHLPDGIATPVRLTLAQRDDLLYAFSQSSEANANLKFRLVILEGALDAVLAHVPTLEDMYPYQQRALQRENAGGPNDRSYIADNPNPDPSPGIQVAHPLPVQSPHHH